MKSLSRFRLFATPWTVASQAPPSVGFSRQEYWSGLPFPSPTYICIHIYIYTHTHFFFLLVFSLPPPFLLPCLPLSLLFMGWKQLHGPSELCSCLSEPYWHVRKRGKINLTVIVKQCTHFPPLCPSGSRFCWS